MTSARLGKARSNYGPKGLRERSPIARSLRRPRRRPWIGRPRRADAFDRFDQNARQTLSAWEEIPHFATGGLAEGLRYIYIFI